jgi:4-amino-4-deoxy-L-arabinose transferase-like glycosyltransferase
VGLAGDYVDPIGKITAQDEALYAHSAIRMARQGEWLTPKFMGRYALYKPPLLMWAAGLSARLLGITRIGLRLPVALLAAFAVGLIFLWAAEVVGWQAGAAAALLVMGNRQWHVLAGMCMTDGLLVAFYTAAMYCLFSDPWLESGIALWGFSASVAAAILTKSIAGVLPLAVLGLYWLVAPRQCKPCFRRVGYAGALSLALAAPWFAYQLLAHQRWFWTEQVLVEILGFGAGAPQQTSQENLAATDPVLLASALVAIPAWALAVRKQSGEATLLACWLAVLGGAVLGWQYRNASYLLPMVPALAILATTHGPLTSKSTAPWMLLLVCATSLGKAALPEAPFGISFEEGTVQKAKGPLSDYCERARGNELIVADVADDLYASTLPLAGLRYCTVGVSVAGGKYAMPFDYMGIAIAAQQFDDLAKWEPSYRRHLREWGLDSSEPIGTLIVVQSTEELAAVVRAHPASDFFLPAKYHAAMEGLAPQELVGGSSDYFLLLSREHLVRPSPPAWACRL